MSKISTDILIDVLKYSIECFNKDFINNKKFRQEIYLALVLTLIGLFVGETTIQKILLISSILIMVIVDLLNLGIKLKLERISFKNLKSIALIKNITATAVYFAAINLLVTWLLILFPLI